MREATVAYRAGQSRSAPDGLRPADALSESVQLVLAALAILFFAPLLAAIAAAIWLQDGRPILFAQQRVGRGGRPFRCWKFRSMSRDAEARLATLLERDPSARAEWDRDQKLRNDPRVTPLGAFLRKSSLDELPQLFNVLRGEMNLVGPRPIVAVEIERYGWRFTHYCAVKPGITGLWQVSGRTDVSYRARVAIDSLYARKRSLALDISIMIATPAAVLLRRGSY